jgi:hypothetical protein
MNNVIKAERTGKGAIIHTPINGEARKYAAVRGGISWPLISENLPGYFCIYGEEQNEARRFKGQENIRGRLCFLCEYEAPDINTSLTNFFTRLTDAIALYLCSTLYTVMEDFRGESFREYAEMFQTFAYNKETIVRLEEAPWQDRPDLGVCQIQSWRDKGLLDIPEESLICAQLRTLQASTVKTIPGMLNAVNALRFLVCGFEKDKPINDSSNWRKHVRKGSWRV